MTAATTRPHDPRAEAQAMVPEGWEARVLEPSPPAVTEPPWFADDPVARGDVPSGRRVVSPVSTGDAMWSDLAAGDRELERWCAERWLGAYLRLQPAPAGLPATRRSLHAVAEHVVSRARERVNGKIGLRYTRGGFGTPFFGEDAQVRVEGTELVAVEGDAERRIPVTSLATAAEHVWPGADPATLNLPADLLTIDPPGAAFLADWFGFAASVLEELRARVGLSENAHDLAPSRVQLWPEHFDMAVEVGSETAGQRAAYGLSPGDDEHDEPYAYVAPWNVPPEGELWNATAFRGAELRFGEILAAAGQREAVLDFLKHRLAALTAA